MATLQPCKAALRKNIADFPLYTVDNYGEVRNIERGKAIAYSIQKNGYTSVRCCKDKEHKRILLHRLVLSSFVGYQQGKNVDHKDDNPRNNNLTNLRWVTQSENVQKAYDSGRAKSPKAMTGKIGDLHHSSILIVGYKDGLEVLRFESISLARAAGYSLDFYKKRKNRVDGVAICKGITFKKVSNG